jgi:predicted hydrocarbon binding protein
MTFEAERGALSLQAARYVVFPPTVLMEIQKSVESYLPEEAEAVMREPGITEGANLASRYRDVFQYPPEQVLSSVAFLLSESGWGSLVVEMANLEGRELVFKVTDSPFAEVYGPSTRPVCHTVLGVLQGVGMTLFDSEVDGMEVQCIAKGDTTCRFVVSARPA